MLAALASALTCWIANISDTEKYQHKYKNSFSNKNLIPSLSSLAQNVSSNTCYFQLHKNKAENGSDSL